MNDPFFFGYGSLVNRNTHDYGQAHPAQISGWRRAWRRSPSRDLCYLTAVPDPASTIEGLIAAVPNGDWAALDIRERDRKSGVEGKSGKMRIDIGGRRVMKRKKKKQDNDT